MKQFEFIVNQNHLGWKTPLRPASPTVNLALPGPPVNHVPISSSPMYPLNYIK